MEIVVFTNGCFDLLHPGHVDLLKKARALGTRLIVGLNSDRSVRAIKGASRPFLNETARAAILKELRSVDEVRIFDENTPDSLIREIKPDVLVKGGDWAIEQIVGGDFVLKNGGKVFSIPFTENFSTSKIAEKIKFAGQTRQTAEPGMPDFTNLIENFLSSQIENFEQLLRSEKANITYCAEMILKTIENGSKIFICGEAGGEAVAKYFEFVFNRYFEQANLASRTIIVKSGNTPSEKNENENRLDNDDLRLLEESLRAGDLLIIISTNEFSQKVISTIMKGRELGCHTIGLTGKNTCKLASLCDAGVTTQFDKADSASSGYIALANLWCQLMEEKIKLPGKLQNG